MARDARFTSRTPAVEQAAEILRYLASTPSLRVGLAAVSSAVGINRSKTHVVLDALHRSGFVQKDPTTKLYSLGFGVIPLGLTALRNANYRDTTRPLLVELAAETGCSALFGLVVREELVITDKEHSRGMLQARSLPGDTFPAFYSAHGRAILSGLDARERREIFETKYDPGLDRTPKLSYEEISRELDACRDRGFAYSCHRTAPGQDVKVLASAVFDSNRRPFGCVMVVGLMPDSAIETCGAKVAEGARRLMFVLGGSAPLEVPRPLTS